MSDNSWEKTKHVLRERLKLDETRIIWLEEVRGELQNLASAGISTSPDFTLHNEIHSDNVVMILGELSSHVEPKLSEYETYLLIVSAYLHDIGMFVGAGRYNITILPDLPHTLQVCPHDKCDSGVQYVENIKGKSTDYQIRAVHHLISAHMIDKDGAAQFHLSPLDLSHVIAICRGHRKADLSGRECDCYKNIPTKSGLVRRDLLASLLRLADALDFYPERAPERVFRERAYDFLADPVALKHWMHHYFVRSVYISPNDKNGNRSLDCHVTYVMPVNRTLNGKSYSDFIRPLIEQFINEASQGDFNIKKYPSVFFDSLKIRDLKIEASIKPELGVAGLPESITHEIEKSQRENVLDFINYLEAKSYPLATASIPVMDRRPEVQAFRTILDGDDPQHRLILITGEPGQGKTWLMNTFERFCVENQQPCFKVDLSANISVEDILNGIWQRVGPGNFPKYSELREWPGSMDARPYSERQRELTQCFFSDWQALVSNISIVLLLDIYEKAAPSTKKWVENQFLEGLQNIPHAIVAIGGREWPRVDDQYWTDHCYRFPLNGVQLRDYREYAKQRGVSISEDELVLLHKKWGGLPKLFDEYLNNLSLGL